jgi:hypothetical protein
MALVLFGKLTAPSKAVSGSISVTSSTVKVGAAASVAAAATSKTAIVSLATAGVLAVGSMVATSGPESGVAASGEKVTERSYVLPQEVQAYNGSQEYWYYYPSKASETVMMRIKRGESQYLQNAEANYYFDGRRNTVHIENYLQWREDLAVRRLPTDSFELTGFLAQIDGRERRTEDVYRSQGGLLLVIKQPGDGNGDQLQVTRHYNVLGEDYFKYVWPANVKVVDRRDAMHKRGWTYFRIKGQIDGKEVRGSGRIPFVYAASGQHWPWIRVRIGGEEFIDKEFSGFGRPWMGLHTIDIVRREAAEKEIPFETALRAGESKGQVILNKKGYKSIYIIDMEKDVVERIIYSGEKEGELVFTYLQQIGEVTSEFAVPRGSTRTKKAFSILEAE